MGDYLGDLVARSLGLADVVQPRPVSLFEPPAVAGWPDADRLSGLEMADGEQSPGEGPRDLRSTARPPVGYPMVSLLPVISPRRPPEPGQHPPGGFSAVADWRPGRRSDQPHALAPVVSRPTQAERQVSSDHGGPDPARPTPAPMTGPLAEPGRARPSAGSASQPRGPGRPKSRLATPRDEAKDAPGRNPAQTQSEIWNVAQDETPGETLNFAGKERGRRRALEPVVQRVTVERLAAPAAPPSPNTTESSPTPAMPSAVVTRPRVRAYVEATAPAPAGSTATPEPDPTIQVTIGRVEVRATPPPAPAPRKERSVPPVMSLEEYLRRRDNGGSR
jgi:hypothetical protein